MRREDRPTFARAVWAEFQRLAGTQRDPSAAEYWVLSGWMDPVFDSEGRMVRDSIPLPVILRAFGEFKGVPRKLEAMQTPVRKAYDYYRQAMAL